MESRITARRTGERRFFRRAGWVAVSLLAFAVLSCADELEFLNGTKIQGTVKSIRKAEKQFDFELLLGGKEFESRGRVVHVHEGGLAGEVKVHSMGVEFEETSKDQLKILESFIRDELEKNV